MSGSKSKKVYTNAASKSELDQEKPPTGVGLGAKTAYLKQQTPPLASQVRTFQRGMALNALLLPPDEREEALREVLQAVGLDRAYHHYGGEHDANLQPAPQGG